MRHEHAGLGTARLAVITMALLVASALAAGIAWGAAPRVTIPREEYDKAVSTEATFDGRFGESVAIFKDRALIGADRERGTRGRLSFQIRGSFLGPWGEQAWVTVPGGVPGDRLGYSVALDETLAVAGAPWAGVASEGRAYTAALAGGVWSLEPSVTQAGGSTTGEAVAISGRTALVGAPSSWVSGASNAGLVSVFVRSGTAWTQQATLTAPVSVASDHLGAGIDITGDTAIVGAYGRDTERGLAWVFRRSGSTWSREATLSAPDAANMDQFGRAVAVSGDTAFVGALGKYNYSGVVYVFDRVGPVWSFTTTLGASDPVQGDDFGASVALDGDKAVIGAPLKVGPGAAGDQGAAYAFTRAGGVWSELDKLMASDGAAGDQLGQKVDIQGGQIIAGAPTRSDAFQWSGAAYFFDPFVPVTTVVTAPPSPDGLNGWYVTAPVLTLAADEPANVRYRWDTVDPWLEYSGASLVAQEGTHTVECFARDGADNTETAHGHTFMTDTRAPFGTVTLAGGAALVTTRTVRVDATMDDTNSGLTDIRVSFGNGVAYGPWTACAPPTQTAVATLTAWDGIKTVRVQFRDRAGKVAQATRFIQYRRPRALVYRPTVSPSIPRRYGLTTLSGVIAPRVAGKTRLYVYRWSGGRYVRWRGPLLLTNRYVTGQNRSKWTYAFRPPYTGKWYAYAYWPGDRETGPDTSATKFFTVR